MTLRRNAVHPGALLLPLALLGGCGTVLGLGDFDDADAGATSTTTSTGATSSSGSGGSGGSGTTTTSTSAGGGMGGGGGDGGGHLVGNCSLQAEAFDIFSAGEIAGEDVDTRSVRIIRGAAGGSDVFHVTAGGQNNHTLYARTVHGGASLGPIATFTAAQDLRVVDALDDGVVVRVAGIIDNEVAEVFFQHNGGDLSDTGVAKQGWGTDVSCAYGPQRLGFAWTGSVPSWAYSCDGGMGTNLIAGDGLSGSFQVSTGVMDNSNDVRGYARLNDRHFIVTGSDGPGTAYIRYGLTQQDLSAFPVLTIDATPGYASLYAGSAPHASGGFTMIGASLQVSPFDATMWAGLITDIAAFSAVPPTGLAPIATYDDPAKVGEQSDLALGDQVVGFARVPFTQKEVNMSWLTDLGAPLLIDSLVQSAPAGTTYWSADVAFGPSNLNVLVVWLESTGGVYSVKGQRLICGTSIE